MKKKKLNYSKIFIAIVLVLTMLTSCTPKAPENSGESSNEIVVDNTNANVVKDILHLLIQSLKELITHETKW